MAFGIAFFFCDEGFRMDRKKLLFACWSAVLMTVGILIEIVLEIFAPSYGPTFGVEAGILMVAIWVVALMFGVYGWSYTIGRIGAVGSAILLAHLASRLT
jgi:hypothetical protein